MAENSDKNVTPGGQGLSDAEVGRIAKQAWTVVSRRNVLTALGPMAGVAAGYFGANAQGASGVPPASAPESAPVSVPGADSATYLIESVHYMCHLERGRPGPRGRWGEPGSTLLSRIHITYTCRANASVEETDEYFRTTVEGAALRSFFSTVAVKGESRTPGAQEIAVKLAFPLKKGDLRTYATGVDIEYTLPLKPKLEMATVEVGEQQYFVSYPNESDYIKHATITVQSTALELTNGQFATQKRGHPTLTVPIVPQAPCLGACKDVWHQVITASTDDVMPGGEFGIRVSWA